MERCGEGCWQGTFYAAESLSRRGLDGRAAERFLFNGRGTSSNDVG
jgi:hypothetical protein